MRELAKIVRIDEILPIEGADAIEQCVVGGWLVVTKKGDYQAGDLAVYCEIDSFIPTEIAPFLTKPGQSPKEYNGVKGERLKTIRLKNALSQGLLLKLESVFPTASGFAIEGTDVADLLGIQKWEAPIPAHLAGQAAGDWPAGVQKTDQQRIQTLRKEWESEWKYFEWEVTEKLEGCLFEGTLVSTPAGVVPIERIKVGDKVVSYNPDTCSDEVQVVTGTLHRSNVEDWIEIELEDGTVVTMTPNHLVYLPEYRCYRRADQLIVGDITKKL